MEFLEVLERHAALFDVSGALLDARETCRGIRAHVDDAVGVDVDEAVEIVFEHLPLLLGQRPLAEERLAEDVATGIRAPFGDVRRRAVPVSADVFLEDGHLQRERPAVFIGVKGLENIAPRLDGLEVRRHVRKGLPDPLDDRRFSRADVGFDGDAHSSFFSF